MDRASTSNRISSTSSNKTTFCWHASFRPNMMIALSTWLWSPSNNLKSTHEKKNVGQFQLPGLEDLLPKGWHRTSPTHQKIISRKNRHVLSTKPPCKCPFVYIFAKLRIQTRHRTHIGHINGSLQDPKLTGKDMDSLLEIAINRDIHVVLNSLQ